MIKPWMVRLSIAAIALLGLPLGVHSPYLLHILILLFLSTALGESWNILGGYAGQYSIGHAAFYGVGAYTTMILLQSYQIAPWWGAWLGIGMAIVTSLVVGSICFRLRGPYFVLASIAVGEIFRICAINLPELTHGAQGILATEVPQLKLGSTVLVDFSSKVPYYYMALGLAAFTIWLTYRIENSKLGFYLQAIREDQDAADSLGINLAIYKNIALVLSAVLTALAGSMMAVYIGYIDPGTGFSIDQSIEIGLTCIIGGVGTIFGPMIGALVLVPLSEALRANLIAQALFKIGILKPDSSLGRYVGDNLAHAHVLIYGILLVIVMLFMPDGVLGFIRKRSHARHAARIRKGPK